MEEKGLALTLDLQQGYQFLVDFRREGIPSLLMDEPPPLGGGSRLECLQAPRGGGRELSQRQRALLSPQSADPREGDAHPVQASFLRNPQGRLRIGGIEVKIQPEVAPEHRERMGRCLELFEEFCVVTQSVRNGIDVKVEVEPASA
jgi:hypothetical protein